MAATIANRKCFAYLKKKKYILVDEQIDDEGNSTDYFENIADDESFIPENIFDNQEKIKIIRGIIDDLTDVQRACVIGFYYNEQKQDEIAEQLGIPVNTVKSHLNRAKSKIKEAVGDIEKKQGIKLLSVIPFMVALFGFETKAYAAELVVPAMSTSVASAVAAKGTVSMGTVAAKATGTAEKSAGMALKTKIAIGLVAGALGIGAVAGSITSKKPEEDIVALDEVEEVQEVMEETTEEVKDDNNSVNVVIDCKELIDKIEIFGFPLSAHTRYSVESEVFRRVELIDAQYEKDFYSEGTVEMTRWYDAPNQIGLYKSYPGKIDPNNEDIRIAYDYHFDGESDLMFDAWQGYFIKGEESYSSLRLTGDSDNGILNWMFYDSGEESVWLSIYSNEVDNSGVLNYQYYLTSFDTLLNGIYPDLYEIINNNNEVIFSNGILRASNNNWYELYFDDAASKGCVFNSISFSVDDSRNIQSVWFSTKDVNGNINPQKSINENANVEFKDVESVENITETIADDSTSRDIDENKYYWITLWYQGDQAVDELYYKMSKDSDWIFVGDNPIITGDGYDVRVKTSDINGYMAIKSVVNGKEYISESNDVRIGYITFVVQGVEEPHYADGDTFDYVNAYFGLDGGIGMDWY